MENGEWRISPEPRASARAATPLRRRHRAAQNALACLVLLLVTGLVRGADAPLFHVEGLPFEIGTLDAASAAGEHPRLFLSPQEVEAARQRIAGEKDPHSLRRYGDYEDNARAILDRFLAEADKHLSIAIEPIDESWWGAAKDKPWQQTYPEVFENTWIRPSRYAKPAAALATAWLLTDERKYADKAVELLMNLAPFSFRMEHFDVGMNYSVWGVDALKAYDALFPVMSAEQRKALDGCMTRLAWAVAKNDVYWIGHNIGGGINNHLAWHKMMLGLLGLFYGRDDMVDYCLNGRRGLISLLEDGLLDDGLWCESSLNYQFAAIAPMLVFADCQRRVGHEPALHKLTAANGRTLKQSYDAMFNVLAPNGLIPPIGDCYGSHKKLYEVPLYELCWRIWQDDKYAWLIRRNPEPTADMLFAPPVPPATYTLPNQDRGNPRERYTITEPTPPVGSILLPEHGYAILRHPKERPFPDPYHLRGGAYWNNSHARMAFLTYDRSGVHANADKLSLMLFGQNRMLLSDVEARTTTQAHAFSSKVQGELNRSGLSQNTVMIDGRDQRCSNRMLDLVEFRDLPDEKRVTAADHDGILYDGVRQMRTVAMTPDYVLDVFQVDCGDTERQIDWIAHVLNENATPLPEATGALESSEPFALPEARPWPWLRDARSFKPDGPIQLGWQDGEARLRLVMLNPGNAQVLLCGYPATDEPDPPTIPMVIVRTRANRATFATIWLIGDAVRQLDLKLLHPREDNLTYEIRTDATTRRHLLPTLSESR